MQFQLSRTDTIDLTQSDPTTTSGKGESHDI